MARSATSKRSVSTGSATLRADAAKSPTAQKNSVRSRESGNSRIDRGMSCPGPTRHTELKRPARKSQSIPQPYQPMAKVDDLLEKRAKTGRPGDRRAAGSSVSPTANLAVEGITDHPNRESQTARKPACTPGFLAKSITCSGQIISIDQSLPHSSRTPR